MHRNFLKYVEAKTDYIEKFISKESLNDILENIWSSENWCVSRNSAYKILYLILQGFSG